MTSCVFRGENDQPSNERSTTDFADRVGRFDPIPALSETSVVPYRTTEDAAALLPRIVRLLKMLETDYDALFATHQKQHAELFDRVSIDLGGGEDRAKTSDELLAIASREPNHSSPRCLSDCCRTRKAPRWP